MEELEALLAGQATPNIYRLMSRAAAETIIAAVEVHGWRCFTVDGDTITDKKSFLEQSAAAMHFPTYFGRNWDAFEECLFDLSWAPAAGYVLLYDNVEKFARQSPHEWSVAYAILVEAVSRWQKQGIPFVVLMRKTGNFVRGLPQITL